MRSPFRQLMPPSSRAGSVSTERRRAPRDSGAVDASIEMLFGSMALLMVLLLLFEATAYWHARNVFDEAATEGVRVAAAYASSCDEGIAAAESIVGRMASGWSSSVRIECSEAAPGRPMVSVTVSGRSPGVLAGSLGFAARVTESAPAER